MSILGQGINALFAKVLGNSLAPKRIFNAILHSLFSAAAELASLRHPRRPTSSGPLEERIPKAKSAMVAAAISQNLLTVDLPLKSDRISIPEFLGNLTE